MLIMLTQISLHGDHIRIIPFVFICHFVLLCVNSFGVDHGERVHPLCRIITAVGIVNLVKMATSRFSKFLTVTVAVQVDFCLT